MQPRDEQETAAGPPSAAVLDRGTLDADPHDRHLDDGDEDGGERAVSDRARGGWVRGGWLRGGWLRRVHPGLVAALVIGGALRWLWWDYAQVQPISDFRHYQQLAHTLLDQGFFGVDAPSAWRLPVWPALLAAASVIRRDTVFLSGVAAAVSLLQVALTYWLAWRVFDRRGAASVAGLVAAVAPAFVTFAPVLASEHLLAVLVLASLIAALRTGARPWLALLAGALGGAAVLTRGEALAYLPALVVAAVGTRWNLRRAFGPAVVSGLLVVVGMAAVVTPWIVRNERVVGPGAGLTTTGGFNFYLAHSPGPYGWRRPLPLPLLIDDEIVRDDLGWRYGLQYARDNPDDLVPTIVRGTRALLAPSDYAAFYATLTTGPAGTRQARDDLALRDDAIRVSGRSSLWLLAAGAFGLLLLPVWRARAWLAVVGIVAANWVVYAVVFWAQARYRFVVDALACVAIGAIPAGIATLGAWIGKGWDAPARGRITAEGGRRE